ncbi:N-acyl-D-amino-acid deacylase family protein [Dankookia sp. P2]|uniref:N-acyl-D-amino-acid deacylase family protein n=1 Tax=Dankookia sp. P2 TaxID=3423955 RepID=UPI003D67231B
MHDVVIRGGTIVDGTGAPAFQGDVALDGDRIAQVGGKAGPARREIQAEGRLVTPGWVDVHTHYDGQATWDPVLAPSSWHGATTIMFGNCGVGFAPVRKAHHQALIDLMEGVEDIPGIALAEGLKWDWESFPEYLDALSRLPRTIDVAAQIAHHPLRVYAMGERAIARELATPEDIDLMARLTEEALRAGAFGFTTSRTDQHKTPAGDLVPGRYADHEELIAIGRAMGRAGRGAFGMLSDFEDEAADFAWMNQVAKDSKRPVWFLLTDRSYDPQRWRRLMDGVRAARAQGLPLSAQVAGRPVGLILGLTTSLNPFALRESFAELARLSPAEQLARLRDPAVRAQILSEEASPRLLEVLPPLSRQIATRWDRMYDLGGKPDYEPPPERSIAALAAKAGQTPQEYCYDFLTGAMAGGCCTSPSPTTSMATWRWCGR